MSGCSWKGYNIAYITDSGYITYQSLKTKTKAFKIDLQAAEWHTLHITVSGDTMSVKIDGQDTGSFSSEGIAHPTKRMLTLAVNKSARVDDVKVWRLK